MPITITRDHDTTAELLEDYRQDYESGYDAGRPRRRYNAQTEVGTLSLIDTTIVHTDDGDRDGWRLLLWGGEYDLTRESQYPLPDPDELAEQVRAIIQRAKPAAAITLTRQLDRLGELAIIIDHARDEMRAVAVSAVTEHGVEKINVARAAGISRSTLDRWLASE